MARSKVPGKVLNQLLQDCAAHTAQCAQCLVGPVVEISTGHSGCNWKVSRMQGSHCGDCLLAMADFIAELQARFALDPEADMDPTLLTTWAMR